MNINPSSQPRPIVKLPTTEYVHILALNEARSALILEACPDQRTTCHWQVLGDTLRPNEDPLQGAQRVLQEQAGLQCDSCIYLTSYACERRIEHFFCANRAVAQLPAVTLAHSRWIPLKELRRALVDGRINDINQATSVALTLLHLG